MLVELHCHFRPNKYKLEKGKELVKIAASKGIELMCITEHTHQVSIDFWTEYKLNEIKGDTNMLFIVAQEVTTDIGDVLIFGSKLTYPKGTSIEEIAKNTDTLKILAHPFRKQYPTVVPECIEALEIMNKSYSIEDTKASIELARKSNIYMVSGSDIHLNRHVGLCPVLIPEINNWRDLRNNLKNIICTGIKI